MAFSAHRDIAAPPQMDDKANAPAILAGFGSNDAHDVAVELKLDFRVW
jgi:hypothetical protein